MAASLRRGPFELNERGEGPRGWLEEGHYHRATIDGSLAHHHEFRWNGEPTVELAPTAK